MIKKISLLIVLVSTLTALSAQNFQVHYDMGKDRKYVTTTMEMFKPDKWGSTFFFVDFDYNANDVKGVALAYMEISRALRFWDSPFALQVDYNGGFGQYRIPEVGQFAYQINDAWLAGAQYTWNTADFSRYFTLQTLYKNIRGKEDMSFQITGVWGVQLMGGKLSFVGFADFWKEEHDFGSEGTTKFVFLSEPQLWYNFSEKFALGGEVEFSSNFAGNKGFMTNPTLGLKWTF